MSGSSISDLGEGIVYRAMLPFEWHPLDIGSGEGVSLAQAETRTELNERRLRIISILNEYPSDMSDELHHLEFKINLLLEIMGEILATQLDLPPKVMLYLSAKGLRWQDEPSVLPEKGQKVVLDVYLHPQFPKPVSFSGRVEEITEADGGRCNCFVRFDELPETLHDQLEKLIFTHHRREVAHARHHT